jgi:UDP-3-O-[3-hydroxymyristoyl] glucosamine N-acyltransferase
MLVSHLMKLSEIAGDIGARVHRDGEFLSLGKIVEKDQISMLTFLDSPDYLKEIQKVSSISAVLTNEKVASELPAHLGCLIVDNPRASFIDLHHFLLKKTDFYGVPFSSVIDPSAEIFPGAHIAPEGVRIGKRAYIEPGVVIMSGVTLGDDVVVRAGTTLGTEGFEFTRSGGRILPVRHAGGVMVGNGVEIQANCSVSKGLFKFNTTLGEDTKLDNLVHVAHNVRVGKRCFIAASAMIAGRVEIGDDVWIGPGSSISSQITIGNKAKVTLGSVVLSDVSEGDQVTGYWAVQHKKFLRNHVKTYR